MPTSTKSGKKPAGKKPAGKTPAGKKPAGGKATEAKRPARKTAAVVGGGWGKFGWRHKTQATDAPYGSATSAPYFQKVEINPDTQKLLDALHQILSVVQKLPYDPGISPNYDIIRQNIEEIVLSINGHKYKIEEILYAYYDAEPKQGNRRTWWGNLRGAP